MLGFGVGV
jgi:dipeptidyl-peptidase 4